MKLQVIQIFISTLIFCTLLFGKKQSISLTDISNKSDELDIFPLGEILQSYLAI